MTRIAGQRTSNNRSSLTLLAILLLVTLAGCETTTETPVPPTETITNNGGVTVEAEEISEDPVEEEKVLIIGHSETTVSYDLANALNPTSRMVHRATYDTLVTFPDDGASTIVPSLARSWDVSEDGLTYTFYLRDDVNFRQWGSPYGQRCRFLIQSSYKCKR